MSYLLLLDAAMVCSMYYSVCWEVGSILLRVTITALCMSAPLLCILVNATLSVQAYQRSCQEQLFLFCYFATLNIVRSSSSCFAILPS